MSKAPSAELLNAISRNSPVQIAKHIKTNFTTERGIEFSKVIATGYYLREMTSEFTEPYTIAYLTVLFSDLLNYFNVKTNLTEGQLDYFVYEFYENYKSGLHDDPSYTIEDVAIFCQQAKTGKFGKVYQSIDGSILNEWLAIYDSERYESYRQHLQHTEKLESESNREIKNPPSEETMSKFREKYQQVVNTLGQTQVDENEQLRRQRDRIESRKKLFYGADVENAEQMIRDAVEKMKTEPTEEEWAKVENELKQRNNNIKQ